ncbi:hypothetical protein A3709_18095 [Halioglobus sp. HI00S01]|uniref:hypothetical protein n=1 Tax=Halioglobus sp. HI00S01 TaxID=1822214 RepID=UPI0007C34BEB|nr:hypothetical protein [Halioglobus sp. HI00S01]KZX58618.1 hypothetical protein A3709_18095 [Halioglobus sp. HI00S01]
MKRVLLTATPALATQLVSALAHASAPVGTAVTTVTVAPAPTPEPTPAAPPVAAPNAGAKEPTLPVPVMDDLLLIVVGLMLMAVAFRSLRNSKGAQKLLSIAALGGSLTLVGMGADRTIAIGIMDNPIAPTCEGGDITGSDATTANSVTNNCESDQEILNIESETVNFEECTELQVRPENEGTCEAGLTLVPGESCETDIFTPEDSGVCI